MRSCHIVVECKQVPLKMSQAVRYFLSVHIYAVVFGASDLIYRLPFSIAYFRSFSHQFFGTIWHYAQQHNAFSVFVCLALYCCFESFSCQKNSFALPNFRLLWTVEPEFCFCVCACVVPLQNENAGMCLTFKSHENQKWHINNSKQVYIFKSTGWACGPFKRSCKSSIFASTPNNLFKFYFT